MAREIGRAITAALSRRGVAGTVVVRGNHAEVHAPGLDVLAIELDWISQWNLLPPEMQQKRADHAAERLQEVMRAARGQRVTRSFDIGALLRRVLVPAIALIVVGTLGWWLWRSNFFGRGFFATTAGEASASVDPQAEERARRQRACEAGRRRLFAGADMGLDVDGWVVELWLARPVDRGALENDAALARAIENARSVFKEGPGELTIGRAEHRGALGLESAVVRMSGVFVSAFFETTRRVRLETVSEETARAVAADHAALYARCEHLTSRDVGAWYFGRDRNAALASLVYSMGGYAEPPAFDEHALGGGALVALRDRLAKASAPKLDDILQRLGTRVVETPGAPDAGPRPAIVRFPFGGPTHPIKAAREMSVELGLK